MRIVTQTEADNLPELDSYHVLTYAEEGFAPLNIHARRFNLTNEELAHFAKMVNEQEGIWCLYPQAPISALPRSIIRGSKDTEELFRHIEAFLKLNSVQVKSPRVIFDFRTPNLEQFVLDAIEGALANKDGWQLEDAVVVATF
jgi:hypothetical protein